MNSRNVKCFLQNRIHSKRTINLFDYRKYHLFRMMTNQLQKPLHLYSHPNRLKNRPTHHSINHRHGHSKINHPSTRLQCDHHHFKLLLLIGVFACLTSVGDSARVYKGKKHSTNSPIFYISQPFLPNRPINHFPPPPRSPQQVHSSNILPSVYNNLIASSTTIGPPVSAVTAPTSHIYRPQDGSSSVLNQLNPLNSLANQNAHGLEASIAGLLLKAKANPNSFVNRLNASVPTSGGVSRFKVRRRKLKANSTLNTSQPVKTIDVNFSIADLKKTFDTLAHLRPANIVSQSIASTQSSATSPSFNHAPPTHPSTSPPVPVPVRLIDQRMDSAPVGSGKPTGVSVAENRVPFKMGDQSLNLLGEIILNSLQSKFHNLPLKFLSNGQPNQVILNSPRKKIKMKKSQNSKIINLKLKYLSNAQPFRALINPFGVTNSRKIKVSKKLSHQ